MQGDEKKMKKNRRFIITEIYQDDLHAVDKVLVDTQTRVQYLLHQEGSGCSCCVLLNEEGKPLLSDSLTRHPDSIRVNTPPTKEKDYIQYRKESEPLAILPRIEVKRRRRKGKRNR